MKREFRKIFSALLIALMMISMLVMPSPLAKPVYAATDQNSYSEGLTKVLNYYQSNDYSNATDWWDMVGLWGAGDTQKISWDGSKTSLAGNILGSLAKGEDPSNALNGRNLLAELKATQDSSTGAFPGSYGPTSSDQIWAMVALDAAKTQYDQVKAVSNLLTYQNEDGGFFYSPGEWTSGSDPDQTGMALLALANHQTVVSVTESINNAKVYLERIQEDTGGFAYWGTVNPNSIATVISGLVAVGEDPLADGWKKNGKPWGLSFRQAPCFYSISRMMLTWLL